MLFRSIDLLQDIKQHHAGVEVIIITGYGSLKSAMEGIRHGAAGYLLKPFNVTELISIVNQTLEKKQRLDFLRHFIGTSTGLWGSETACAHAWKPMYFATHGVAIVTLIDLTTPVAMLRAMTSELAPMAEPVTGPTINVQAPAAMVVILFASE